MNKTSTCHCGVVFPIDGPQDWKIRKGAVLSCSHKCGIARRDRIAAAAKLTEDEDRAKGPMRKGSSLNKRLNCLSCDGTQTVKNSAGIEFPCPHCDQAGREKKLMTSKI